MISPTGPTGDEPPLIELRASIDRIDDRLAALIAQRLRIAEAMAPVKRALGGIGPDPAREREIVERVCRERALPRPLVEALWRTLFDASLDVQRRRGAHAPPPGPTGDDPCTAP